MIEYGHLDPVLSLNEFQNDALDIWRQLFERKI